MTVILRISITMAWEFGPSGLDITVSAPVPKTCHLACGMRQQIDAVELTCLSLCWPVLVAQSWWHDLMSRRGTHLIDLVAGIAVTSRISDSSNSTTDIACIIYDPLCSLSWLPLQQPSHGSSIIQPFVYMPGVVKNIWGYQACGYWNEKMHILKKAVWSPTKQSIKTLLANIILVIWQIVFRHTHFIWLDYLSSKV
jgi:hypothetical protein